MRTQILRHLSLACLVAALGLPSPSLAQHAPPGRDPGDRDRSTAARQLRLGADLAAKVQTRLLERLAAGETREMLVELADDFAQETARSERKRLKLAEDDEELRAFKREAYEALRQSLVDHVSPGRLTLRKAYRNVPLALIEVSDAAALAELLAQPEVRSVYANDEYETQLAQSLPLIGQPAAAAAGGTGAGTAVCVIDTGVEFREPAFGACVAAGDPGCRVVAARDFATEDNRNDASGHGTNVAGIVAGTAPGAGIAALDVFAGASAPAAAIVDAIDWCIDNRATFNFVAMNLSLGIPTENAGDCDSFANSAFLQAREAGIEPIVAAGNDAFSAGIADPGCSPHAVSVGAVYDASFTGDMIFKACTDTNGTTDQIICFSNSGPNLELLAPGASIRAGGVTGGTQSGTSMAAPHVSGAWAVLRQARPELSPAGVLELLRLTGKSITDPRNGLIRPRIRLDLALDFEPIQGDAEANDRFGASTATGDFDGDGRADAAIGVPYEDVGSLLNAGAVNVVYGAAGGLANADNQLWTQDSPGVPGVAEAGDNFGHVLAAADFDRDGYDDLAIGAPVEDVGSIVDAGAIVILRGSLNGLTTSGALELHQDSPGVVDAAEAGDRFGLSLAAGDLDRDGYADLAIGVPAENGGTVTDSGAVNVLYGSVQGLTTSPLQYWHQDSVNVTGVAEAYDKFGWSLAIGDFDRDGIGDLAIGVPDEDLTTANGSITNGGFVHVLYGTTLGLAASRSQGWSQEMQGSGAVIESNDRFGETLAAGDFDRNGFVDLAIGAADEALATSAGNLTKAGHVTVLYGASGGLSSANNQGWNQGSLGITGEVDAGDRFGASLTTGDFNRDGYADLAIGATGEDLATSAGTVSDGGFVHVLYGSGSRLTYGGSQGWSQNSPGIVGTSENSDRFGSALGAGDFDADGADDLLVGVPLEDLEGESATVTDAGALHVIYGSGSRLGASRNRQWHQDL